MSHNAVNDQVAQAAASLELLLREDDRLVQYGLTAAASSPDQVAFPYAAALLKSDNDSEYETSQQDTQQLADIALQDVDQKLALVESLAVKLSRTSPEAVAGHLLRLHGYQVSSTQQENNEGEKVKDTSSEIQNNDTGTTTLAAIRDRADRLERQSETLETVARRVENSLTRGLTKMENATLRLQRVLNLSSTLKRMLRLQFETSKLQTYDLDDLRDLTRAAASVSVLEDLLDRPELGAESNDAKQQKIAVVEKMRPQAVATASAVRKAASSLLQDLLRTSGSLDSGTNTTEVIQQLGATLQVYYHLGELPDAVWKAVDHVHSQAEAASRQLFNAVTLHNLQENAKRSSKDARNAQKKLKQLRSEAAQEWANGIIVAATLVRNLNRVLCRKTDHVRRQVYVDVVAVAPIPPAYMVPSSGQGKERTKSSFSLFQLFWDRLCHSLSVIIDNVLQEDNGRMRNDVAALYPSVRAASLGIVAQLQETSSQGQLAVPSSFYEDSFAGGASGVLGGSTLLDDEFLEWNTGQLDDTVENPQSAASADSWTRTSSTSDGSANASKGGLNSSLQRISNQSASVVSAGINSQEWKALEGNSKTQLGLYSLRETFLYACQERLCAPLQYMFPDNNVTFDDDGVAINSGLSLLPSKYDIQRFDENIRSELSLADPREGGGDLTLVTMIAETIVSMISEFCVLAKNAMSGVNGEFAYIADDWSMTNNLQHDRKVVAILYAVRNYLHQVPETTFLAPYRPSVLPRHQDAANLCQEALATALSDIDQTAKLVVLLPLCRGLNNHVSSVLAKINHGVYLEPRAGTEDDSPGFIQTHLSDVFDTITKVYLGKFPPLYANIIAERVTTFSIYTYLSNASLVRPLGESARLHMTQDLADLEMALEQLVAKAGSSSTLHHVDQGKPYAELRAVRQMLFWSGLESNKTRTAQEVAKSLLREVWIKDVRPSTIFHYLFSYGPSLLSSPHQAKRMQAEEYVKTLVQLDGSVEAGEDAAWITIMSCCDSYQQRVSSSVSSKTDGDPRVAQIVMTLGQELLRRRRH